MSKKRKIANNCEKATFLIEKKQFDTISITENMELSIHLAGCSYCRIFQKQSKIINLIAGDIFNAPPKKKLMLNEKFKDTLQKNIDHKLEGK